MSIIQFTGAYESWTNKRYRYLHTILWRVGIIKVNIAMTHRWKLHLICRPSHSLGSQALHIFIRRVTVDKREFATKIGAFEALDWGPLATETGALPRGFCLAMATRTDVRGTPQLPVNSSTPKFVFFVSLSPSVLPTMPKLDFKILASHLFGEHV